MLSIQIEEHPAKKPQTRAKNRKIFAAFLLLLAIAFIPVNYFVVSYYVQQPFKNCTGVADNATKFYEKQLAQENVTRIPNYNPTPFLTFDFQIFLKQANLTHGTFNCSTAPDNAHVCPKSIEKWNNLIKSLLQNEILENNSTQTVFYFSRLAFAEKNNVIHKVREKYQIQGVGFYSDEIKPENAFKAKDFDWEQQLDFGIETKTVRVYETDPKIKLDDIQYSCSTGRLEHKLCNFDQPNVKDIVNLAKAVFEMTSFNLTWTTGFSSDWQTIISELEFVGKLQKDFTLLHISNSIDKFYKEQREWCDCVKRLMESGPKCLYNPPIRKDSVKFFLDYKICPSELEEKINATMRIQN